MDASMNCQAGDTVFLQVENRSGNWSRISNARWGTAGGGGSTGWGFRRIKPLEEASHWNILCEKEAKRWVEMGILQCRGKIGDGIRKIFLHELVKKFIRVKKGKWGNEDLKEGSRTKGEKEDKWSRYDRNTGTGWGKIFPNKVKKDS